MQWEFLDKQDLRESFTPNKGHVYSVSMWRTPVPGGWMIMTINSKSSDPQPMSSFYPDPDHLWKGNTPPEANYLLRAAGAGPESASAQLLRASATEPEEQKRLES